MRIHASGFESIDFCYDDERISLYRRRGSRVFQRPCAYAAYGYRGIQCSNDFCLSLDCITHLYLAVLYLLQAEKDQPAAGETVRGHAGSVLHPAEGYAYLGCGNEKNEQRP